MTPSSSGARRYRPRYQAPEELLTQSSVAKRYSRSNSTATTPQRSPPNADCRGTSVLEETSHSQARSSSLATQPHHHGVDVVSGRTDVVSGDARASGPIATSEWMRSFFDHGAVVDVTPKRRVAPHLVTSSSATPFSARGKEIVQQGTPGMTPRPGHSIQAPTPLTPNANIATATPSSQSRRRGASDAIPVAETTMMFGIDFEEIARRRQAIYLAEEGDMYKNAAQKTTTPRRTVVSESTALSVRRVGGSTPRQTFIDVLARKKEKERGRPSPSSAPTHTHKLEAPAQPVYVTATSRPALPRLSSARAVDSPQTQNQHSATVSLTRAPPTSSRSMMQQYLEALKPRITVQPVSVAGKVSDARFTPMETRCDQGVAVASSPHVVAEAGTCVDACGSAQQTCSGPELKQGSESACGGDQTTCNHPIEIEASPPPLRHSGDEHIANTLFSLAREAEQSSLTTINGAEVLPMELGPQNGDEAHLGTTTISKEEEMPMTTTAIHVECEVTQNALDLRPDAEELLTPEVLEIREYVMHSRRGGGSVSPFRDIARHDLQVDATLTLIGEIMRHSWWGHLGRDTTDSTSSANVLQPSLLLLQGEGGDELVESQDAFRQDICENMLLALIEYEVADIVTQLLNDIE